MIYNGILWFCCLYISNIWWRFTSVNWGPSIAIHISLPILMSLILDPRQFLIKCVWFQQKWVWSNKRVCVCVVCAPPPPEENPVWNPGYLAIKLAVSTNFHTNSIFFPIAPKAFVMHSTVPLICTSLQSNNTSSCTGHMTIPTERVQLNSIVWSKCSYLIWIYEYR